jgi:hypothetical protein
LAALKVPLTVDATADQSGLMTVGTSADLKAGRMVARWVVWMAVRLVANSAVPTAGQRVGEWAAKLGEMKVGRTAELSADSTVAL